jgi:hypothetical protein
LHGVAWRKIPWPQKPHWISIPRLRLPWEIYINRDGRRFVAEDEAGADIRERALRAQPGLVFWIVYDARIAREAPPLLPAFDAARLERCFATHPSFVRAARASTPPASPRPSPTTTRPSCAAAATRWGARRWGCRSSSRPSWRCATTAWR